MKISDINKLRKQLIEKNQNDIVKQVHIERYIEFLKIEAKCNTEIRKEGTTVWVENGSQRFPKPHPSLQTKLEISKKIEQLEMAIGIAPVGKSPPVNDTPKKGKGLI